MPNRPPEVAPLALLTLPLFELHPREASACTATRWGSLHRLGPPLDLYDEETLIGVLAEIGLRDTGRAARRSASRWSPPPPRNFRGLRHISPGDQPPARAA